ncbi:hypothetical protein CsSME_00006695 [Camellia sinensis var. sinensis]
MNWDVIGLYRYIKGSALRRTRSQTRKHRGHCIGMGMNDCEHFGSRSWGFVLGFYPEECIFHESVSSMVLKGWTEEAVLSSS